ncbi:MAG: GpE family phage tail protein [Verrucomicrobiota bacterium]|nr:GpE family phage tail protein [Verrucomicrobiota bacterium]
MADIATVFHWSADEMLEMPVDELLDWREKAVARLKLLHR